MVPERRIEYAIAWAAAACLGTRFSLLQTDAAATSKSIYATRDDVAIHQRVFPFHSPFARIEQQPGDMSAASTAAS